MAPRAANSRKRRSPSPDPHGIFSGMIVFLIPKGIQQRRLQVWKLKLEQMGAILEDHLSKRVTHIFASDTNVLLHQVNFEHLKKFTGILLPYQWLESCLKSGERLSEEPYILKLDHKEADNEDEQGRRACPREAEAKHSSDGSSCAKKTRLCSAVSKTELAEDRVHNEKKGELDNFPVPENQCAYIHDGEKAMAVDKDSTATIYPGKSPSYADPSSDPREASDQIDVSELSSIYCPADFNRNITDIFGKLINIYRALGDERRSFSYHKAIPVIEKLPFKIESVDQVKNLPAIGKSMQDHIHEIVTTGKLSKLEHFEQDEKVRSVTLFEEVWGIGPATALKLYEKGHRTLDDLKQDDSLTNSQRLGLKFFDDIKRRIPRHEVRDMEVLLQKAGEDILPGVVIVCGGSYRRGKASCGDMDIIITHDDGESHKGFLPRFVQYLKDVNFLREDLVFSIHSVEGTDSGVDTYFGLCTYPGREQRHRIDLKVYPRNIFAFGLIAWTGNDVLNRRLRLLAESKGYRLDDTGLFLASHSTPGKRGVRPSACLNCRTEKEVFDVLGYPWLEPHERNL